MPYAAAPTLAPTLARTLALALALVLLQAVFARAADPAPPVPIADAAALATALAGAGPGTTLALAGGDYGGLFIKDLAGAEAAPVTLRSADPGNPARFDAMALRGAAHVVLEGLVFDYVYRVGDKGNLRVFQVLDSRDVTIRGAVFDGDRPHAGAPEDAPYGTAFGLAIRFSTDITLEKSEIRDFYRGLVVSESDRITVRGNDMHTIRMDGMNFAQVRGVRVEGNHIHDFNRAVDSGDHADMIQFWTNGTDHASSDIVIRGNVLNSGRGWYTQSIFMRNEEVDRGRAGRAMFYQGVTIEDNVIINAHLHGITVGETAGLVIRRNTLVRNAASQGKKNNPGLWTPQINVSGSSADVRIENNVTGALSGHEGQADWVVANNLLIQDRFPSRPGYYDKVFVAARTGDAATLAPFAYLPGGPLDGTGIGAPRLGALLPAENVTPKIRVEGRPAP